MDPIVKLLLPFRSLERLRERPAGQDRGEVRSILSRSIDVAKGKLNRLRYRLGGSLNHFRRGRVAYERVRSAAREDRDRRRTADGDLGVAATPFFKLT